MTDFDLARALAREDLCRLLAACHYQPESAFTEERIFDAMHDAAQQIDPALGALAQRLAAEFSNDGVETLLVDYTKLFLGPNRMLAAPHGSVWLDESRSVMGESTAALEALYAEAGFELDEGFHSTPDHIAAELEFLYLLTFRENEARRADDPAAVAQALSLRRRFLDEHLGCWIAAFTAAIQAGAQCAFYRTLAELTQSFVAREGAAGRARLEGRNP